jgi:hypothetical protein
MISVNRWLLWRNRFSARNFGAEAAAQRLQLPATKSFHQTLEAVSQQPTFAAAGRLRGDTPKLTRNLEKSMKHSSRVLG